MGRYVNRLDHSISCAAFKKCDCGSKLYCIDSRTSVADDQLYVRRRYECRACGARVTTGEFLISKGEKNMKHKGLRFLRTQRSAGARAELQRIHEALGITQGKEVKS